MRMLLFAVYLLVICSTCGADTPPPYNVSCTDETSATITVNTGYAFSTNDPSRCPIVTNDGSRPQSFSLTPGCLNTAELVIEMVHSNGLAVGSIITSPERHVFTLTCKEDEGKIYGLTKTIAGGQPPTVTEIIKYHPIDRVILLVVKDPPPNSGESFDQLTERDILTVHLGDKLFLTIVATETSDTVLVPTDCRAVIVPDESINTTLWHLDVGKQCIKESNVVKSTFRAGQTNNQNTFTYLQMTAFQYYGRVGSDIKLSCKVKVCRSSPGECDEDKTTLDACTSSASGKRRRRDVGGAPSRDDVHHVTATLHVLTSDIKPWSPNVGIKSCVPHGLIGASATVMFTLPSLLLSLLATVFL